MIFIFFIIKKIVFYSRTENNRLKYERDCVYGLKNPIQYRLRLDRSQRFFGFGTYRFDR